MPARFLRPWEVLEMDIQVPETDIQVLEMDIQVLEMGIQDFHQVLPNGDRLMLVLVDRAGEFLVGYPLSL